MKSNFVSLHPYFKAHPGKLEAVKSVVRQFVDKTATEKDNLFYGFSINGDEIFCREGYENAAELEKLKQPMAYLNPAWFTLEASISR